MSILIKGMDMPENCIKCIMQVGGWCYVSPPEIDERVATTVDEAVEQGKPDWCPLVEVKTPHGRLIDADKFCDEMKDKQDSCVKWRSETEDDDIKNHAQGALTAFIECKLTIDNMPIIIEAEE